MRATRKIDEYVEIALRYEGIGALIAIAIACVLIIWVATFWPE